MICVLYINNKKNTNMSRIILHPEKHSNIWQQENTLEMVEMAQTGDFHVVLEDRDLANSYKNNLYIHKLEDHGPVTPDSFIAILTWAIDGRRDLMLKELGPRGKNILVLYSYVCFLLSHTSQVSEINQIVAKMYSLVTRPTVSAITEQVQTICSDIFGGFPGNINVTSIRDDVYVLIEKRSDKEPNEFAIYHNRIVREEHMAQKIKAVVEIGDQKDIHVFVGATHVSEVITDKLLDELEIPKVIFRQAQCHVKKWFPDQSLIHLLKEYDVTIW